MTSNLTQIRSGQPRINQDVTNQQQVSGKEGVLGGETIVELPKESRIEMQNPARNLQSPPKTLPERIASAAKFKRPSRQQLGNLKKAIGAAANGDARRDILNMTAKSHGAASSGKNRKSHSDTTYLTGVASQRARASSGRFGEARRLNPATKSIAFRGAARLFGDIEGDDDALDNNLERGGGQDREQSETEDDRLAQAIPIPIPDDDVTTQQPETMEELVSFFCLAIDDQFSPKEKYDSLKYRISQVPELLEDFGDFFELVVSAKKNPKHGMKSIADHIRKKLNFPTGEHAKSFLLNLLEDEQRHHQEFPDAVNFSTYGALTFAQSGIDKKAGGSHAVTNALDKLFDLLCIPEVLERARAFFEDITLERIPSELSMLRELLEGFKAEDRRFVDKVLMQNCGDFIGLSSTVTILLTEHQMLNRLLIATDK